MDKKDSLLKKDFNKNDVNRLRNIVRGKGDESTRTQVGYSKTQHIYKENDVWEENGKTWTIKDGIRQNVTKLDKAKKAILLPLFCPKCNNVMNHPYDKQFYSIQKHCFNCQVEFETELKRLGQWEQYQNNIINSDIDGLINSFEEWINEEMNESNDSFVTEQGDIEKWVGSNKEKLLKIKEETLNYLNNLKRDDG
jgi:transcription elongation factor Elf1